MSKKIKLKIKLLHKLAKAPEYKSTGASGFDLCSIEETIIKSGQSILLKTGLAFEIKSGYEVQIRSRSGLALKNSLVVLNSPGTIDSDYRGEIKIILMNFGEDFKINIGDRIAQAVVTKIPKVKIKIAKKLNNTQRKDSGFGSTGLT